AGARAGARRVAGQAAPDERSGVIDAAAADEREEILVQRPLPAPRPDGEAHPPAGGQRLLPGGGEELYQVSVLRSDQLREPAAQPFGKSRARAFCSPTSPPPTTTARRPVRSREIGNPKATSGAFRLHPPEGPGLFDLHGGLLPHGPDGQHGQHGRGGVLVERQDPRSSWM